MQRQFRPHVWFRESGRRDRHVAEPGIAGKQSPQHALPVYVLHQRIQGSDDYETE